MLRFSPSETAILAATDVKAVHNAIDEFLPEVSGSTRTLSASDALALRAVAAVNAACTRDAKRSIVAAIKRAPRSESARIGDLLFLDMRAARRALLEALRTVRALRRMAVSDPEVLGGEPVFRGTRVPVALIAELVAGGESVERILRSYPALTLDKIRLAPLWVRTYPRRGRPPIRPWASDGAAARKTIRRPIAAET